MLSGQTGRRPPGRKEEARLASGASLLFSGVGRGGEIPDEVEATLRLAAGFFGCRPPGALFSVATGVFRELPEIGAVAERIEAAFGVPLHVLRADAEATLLARGLEAEYCSGSVLVVDLGGATTEWAWIRDGRTVGCGSLRLGAIRNLHTPGPMSDNARSWLAQSRGLCDRELETLPDIAARLIVAGGTGRALARCLEKREVRLDELTELIDRTCSEGPPAGLKPHRRSVFLPGLVILERAMIRSGVAALECTTMSLGVSLVGQLLGAAPSPQLVRSELLALATCVESGSVET